MKTKTETHARERASERASVHRFESRSFAGRCGGGGSGGGGRCDNDDDATIELDSSDVRQRQAAIECSDITNRKFKLRKRKELRKRHNDFCNALMKTLFDSCQRFLIKTFEVKFKFFRCQVEPLARILNNVHNLLQSVPIV